MNPKTYLKKLISYPQRMKNRMLSKTRSKLRKQTSISRLKKFSFKPQDKSDYYSFGHWMVSRRLAVFIILILSMIGIYYFVFLSPINFLSKSSDNIREYKYDSIALRLVNGDVKIISKQGDIAYLGHVSKGAANGDGILYFPDGYDTGKIMYSGQFVNNKYEGKGTLYYEEGVVRYSGDFKNNKREGEGTSYRLNGSVEYTGEFRDDCMDGQGTIYDSSNNKVYEGLFSKNNLLCENLLDKSSEEISSIYFGDREVYYSDEIYMVALKYIDMVYSGKAQQDILYDSIYAEEVFALKTSCYLHGKEYRTIKEIIDDMGQPVYEGNTFITESELIAINSGKESYEAWGRPVILNLTSTIDGVYEMSEKEYYDEYVYIYVFDIDKIMYTFYCTDKNQGFVMYKLQVSK